MGQDQFWNVKDVRSRDIEQTGRSPAFGAWRIVGMGLSLPFTIWLPRQALSVFLIIVMNCTFNETQTEVDMSDIYSESQVGCEMTAYYLRIAGIL